MQGVREGHGREGWGRGKGWEEESSKGRRGEQGRGEEGGN